MKKVDLDAGLSQLAQERALRSMNRMVTEARRSILFDPNIVSVPKRQAYFIKLRDAREQVFKDAGINVSNINVMSPESRREFYKSLTLEQRVAYSMAATKVTQRIAHELGLPQIEDVEKVRGLQMNGLTKCKSEQDRMTVKQLTRDTLENVKAKYRRLSSWTADGASTPPGQPGQPLKDFGIDQLADGGEHRPKWGVDVRAEGKNPATDAEAGSNVQDDGQ